MTVDSQGDLEREVRCIYDEANAYATLHGGVQYGMNVLYGPPILKPKVMIVSIQGGAADGRAPQTKWPTDFVYLTKEHPFGKRLVGDFESAGLGDILSDSVVATNIAFPQAPDFGKWRGSLIAQAWLKKSTSWVKELIRLMQPEVILTYGSPPFSRLVGRSKRQIVEQTTFNGTPLVACDHLASRRLTRDDRSDAIDRVRRLIDSRATSPEDQN